MRIKSCVSCITLIFSFLGILMSVPLFAEPQIKNENPPAGVVIVDLTKATSSIYYLDPNKKVKVPPGMRKKKSERIRLYEYLDRLGNEATCDYLAEFVESLRSKDAANGDLRLPYKKNRYLYVYTLYPRSVKQPSVKPGTPVPWEPTIYQDLEGLVKLALSVTDEASTRTSSTNNSCPKPCSTVLEKVIFPVSEQRVISPYEIEFVADTKSLEAITERIKAIEAELKCPDLSEDEKKSLRTEKSGLEIAVKGIETRKNLRDEANKFITENQLTTPEGRNQYTELIDFTEKYLKGGADTKTPEPVKASFKVKFGRTEHLFLSADIPVREAEQWKYDPDQNKLVLTAQPSQYYVGVGFLLGDRNIKYPFSSFWRHLYGKVMIEASRQPLHSYGWAIGYKDLSFGTKWLSLKPISVWVGYTYTKEDKLPTATSSGRDRGISREQRWGVSIDIGEILSLAKK